MSEETLEQKKNRALKVIEILRKTYPQAMVTLDYKTPFQLLVATILAAQCTDERVNQVTPELFRRYPTPEAVAGADESELREIIRPTGFFNQKTKAIMTSAGRTI
ncbi:MAG TPA: endonuclease III, partial [Armatimonadota bacterium]|nr:endonuclease III [Armatimonadota bacterium]